MTQFNISDPGIAQGFASLANIFSGRGAAAVKGDLMRGQRNVLDSEVRYNDARVGLANAQTGLTAQQTADLQAYSAAASQLSEILTGNPDFTSPEVRAQVAGVLPLLKDGMSGNIGGLIGTTGYINPNAYNENDWANVLVAGGVVPNYASTQPGQTAALDNALAQNRDNNQTAILQTLLGGQTSMVNQMLANDGALDVANVRANTPGGNGTPLDISPSDAKALWDMTNAALTRQFGDYERIDPALETTIRAEVNREYQRTRNAEGAIASVLASIGAAREKTDPAGLFNKAWELVPAIPAAPAAAPAAAGVPKASEVDRSKPPAAGDRVQMDDGRIMEYTGAGWTQVQ